MTARPITLPVRAHEMGIYKRYFDLIAQGKKTNAVPGAGELLLVVPTTPWQPGAEAARERQAAEVAKLDARYRGPLPSVVAGDLNAGPDAPSVRALTGRHRFRDAWAAAGEGSGWTWSVDNPLAAAQIAQVLGRLGHRARIDYVLVGPGPGARVTAARLVGDRPVEGVWLSDHAGMLAELDIGFPGGEAPPA